MMQKLLPPVAITVVLSVIGLFSVWAGQPLLVPSLGSAVFGQVLSPKEPSSSVYGTGLGQVLGAVGGFCGVYLAGAAPTPTFLDSHQLVYARVLAVAIAVPVSVVLQLLLKATSPAGGATALIVALGAETATGAGAARLLAGIVLVTLLGEAARRLVLRYPGT